MRQGELMTYGLDLNESADLACTQPPYFTELNALNIGPYAFCDPSYVECKRWPLTDRRTGCKIVYGP